MTKSLIHVARLEAIAVAADLALLVMLQTESEFPWSVYSGKPTVGVGA